jgi:predicted ArsR family transcriptional regulator
MVHEALLDQPGRSATARIIANAAGVSERTARRHLEALVQQGLATRQEYLARNAWGRYTPRVSYTAVGGC